MTASRTEAERRRPPNVILIICDDLGYGDVSCYAPSPQCTPRLDVMAAEGVRFTSYYVPSPTCSASRAGLMTGMYPHRVGLEAGINFPVLLPGDPIGLDPNELTIPRLLKQGGYDTMLIGKWHLGDQRPFFPTRHGFDGHWGLTYSNDMHPDHPHDDHYRFPSLPFMVNDEVAELDPDQTTLTDRYTQAAVGYIREHRDRPFYLHIGHKAPHIPLRPPPRFLAQSTGGDYGAEVLSVDWSTGVILDTLAELGLERDTLVIFTSDHGADTNAGGRNLPLRGGKNTSFEGGMRVPCIVRWPGAIPAGRVCDEMVLSMDLMPTLARICGIAPPDGWKPDGWDISPLLFGQPGACSPHEAFFYYVGRDLQAVRKGRWKYHLRHRTLYDLETDIGESRDRSAEHPQIVAELVELARRCREELGQGDRPGRGCRPPGRVSEPRMLVERRSGQEKEV